MRYTTKNNRVELLNELQDLPPNAFISAEHAAAYLDSTPGTLANWRCQNRGPKFYSNGAFIRYRITDLEAFMNEGTGDEG